MNRLTRKAQIALASASIAAVTGAFAPSASAGLLVTSARGCETHAYSQPFARWGDNAQYTPVDGGSFESGTPAWTLTGGSSVVSGNEPFYVRSSSDSKSLRIPQGGTATSRSICVGIHEPTMRFFAKQNGGLLGSLTSVMTVEVLFETSLGVVLSAPVNVGALNSAWAPSLTGVVVANLLPLMPNDTTAVAFRFRAVTGSWNVDDLYVDPIFRR
jgi:hypothetical protein